MRQPDPPLTVLGVYIKSDAYPNVKYKVDGLLQDAVATREINFAPGVGQRFGGNALRGVLSALRFGAAHLRALMALLRLPAPRHLYVPYPAVFLVYLISFLPRRWRPARLHADAFISLYDTVVHDRQLLRAGHPLARLLLAVERRAYRHADVVLVDTPANAAYLGTLFGLDRQRFVAMPLCIDESTYRQQPYQPCAPHCTVLFIGTFVPLQGVDVIARAIVLLRAQPHIRFRIIGDGQSAGEVQSILAQAGCTNVDWERGWQSAQALAEEIGKADICLGIFGSSAKAARVWPLKNYAYMAVGRALISADTPAARTLAGAADAPWAVVEAARPDRLAQMIVELAADPARRMHYAQAACSFYSANLSNAIALAQLRRSLAAGTGQQ